MKGLGMHYTPSPLFYYNESEGFLQMAEWIAVKGFEGLYEVSNTGKLRGVTRKTTDGKTRVKHEIYGTFTDTWTLRVTLYHPEKKSRNVSIARIVAEAFIPNPDNLPCIAHHDKDRANTHPDNLYWTKHQGRPKR